MRKPKLDHPIVIAAFEGWNDAGEAASQAAGYLGERWKAEQFAALDPEEFYDFTAIRPQVRTEEGDLRVVDWPQNTFSTCRGQRSPDVVLFTGIEPQLKWRTFCDQFLDVAEQLDARLVLTMGALLADVPHSRPAQVFGTAYESTVIDALNLQPSAYEGPTGIVGVLHAECRARGLNSASLWAAVPAYVAAAPSPKAAHALVTRVAAMLGSTLICHDLIDATTEYEHQITEMVEEDDETRDYVRHLEEMHDQSGDGGADDLVNEVERFLREQ
jgi:proteasome assembly chaperone (PAC2) family protein